MAFTLLLLTWLKMPACASIVISLDCWYRWCYSFVCMFSSWLLSSFYCIEQFIVHTSVILYVTVITAVISEVQWLCLCAGSGWFALITDQGSLRSAVRQWLLVLSMQPHSASAAGQFIQPAQAPAGTTSQGVLEHRAGHVWGFVCQSGGHRWYVAI